MLSCKRKDGASHHQLDYQKYVLSLQYLTSDCSSYYSINLVFKILITYFIMAFKPIQCFYVKKVVIMSCCIKFTAFSITINFKTLDLGKVVFLIVNSSTHRRFNIPTSNMYNLMELIQTSRAVNQITETTDKSHSLIKTWKTITRPAISFLIVLSAGVTQSN